MRSISRPRNLIATAICLATLIQAPLAAQSAAAQSPASSARPILYVGLSGENAVALYDARNGRTQIGEITDGVVQPVSLCTDTAGTLYVANSNNTVTAYPYGAASPSLTYTHALAGPAYLAADPQDGSLYVSNSQARTVIQYPAGSTRPSRVLKFSSQQHGIAVSRDGDLYVITGAGDIERFEPGSETGESQGFNLGTGPTQLGIDKDGNYDVLEPQTSGLTLYTKAAPHKQLHSYGFIAGPPGGFGFSPDGNFVFATDTVEFRVVKIAYPQGNFANVIDNVQNSSGPVAVAAPP